VTDGTAAPDADRFPRPASFSPLLSPQKQVHKPAPSNVLRRLATVVQRVGIVAASVFQGLRQDSEVVFLQRSGR
jgi:hypothetical protein